MNHNPTNTSILDNTDLLNRLFQAEYEALIRIDIFDELATTLYTSDKILARTDGAAFSWKKIIRQYILDYAVNTDTGKIVEDFSLENIQRNIKEKNKHIVYYTINDAERGLCNKKAIFLPYNDESLMLIIQDITDTFRSINEDMEALRDALADAKAEISERENFLSLMDQHLRSPLYSLMGITSLVEDYPSSYAFDDYLHKISMSGSYMREAIDDILILRQISRHQFVLNPTTIDMDEFFAGIERMMQPFIVERGLLFEMDTSNLNSISIIADSRCLQQIVSKMLQSAASYTIKGGRIRLHARVVRYKDMSVEIEISAENRGMVIDKERLDILFKPYDYLKERLNKKIGDLDLSLLIMRSCLLTMGGTSITAESDKQTGTRICVNLTVPLAWGMNMPLQKKPVPDFHGIRVLLVDDNEISLDISEKLLFNKGIEIVKARNGKEAVDTFCKEDGRFDMIIMDILMPVMDGLTATRMIRSLPNIENAKTIPIIALTVNAFHEHFEESLRAGMNAHLVKPIEPGSLYQILTRFLGKSTLTIPINPEK